MSGQQDDAEKSHEPTQHKLQEARKKGELVRSADLNTAAAYGGVVLAAMTLGPASVETVSSALMILIGQSEGFAEMFFEGAAAAPVGGLLLSAGLAMAGWFMVPAGMALLSVLAQRAFVVAPPKIRPRLSRIDPVQNARNKYGPSGLFEFAKSFAKLMLYSVVLGLFLGARLSEMAGALHGEPHIIGGLMIRVMVEFMGLVLCIALAIGGVDYLWQRHDHLRRNRMSHREVKDEHKQHEGDPHLKQERRQRATQIASEQMMSDVPGADVVIVNPTHYAVALKWSRLPGSAPVCVAKGVDHVALAIRECARDHGVPIRSDPPSARALHAATEIGDEIDPAHYKAAAAAIRFAETIRRKAKGRT